MQPCLFALYQGLACGVFPTFATRFGVVRDVIGRDCRIQYNGTHGRDCEILKRRSWTNRTRSRVKICVVSIFSYSIPIDWAHDDSPLWAPFNVSFAYNPKPVGFCKPRSRSEYSRVCLACCLPQFLSSLLILSFISPVLFRRKGVRVINNESDFHSAIDKLSSRPGLWP